jgi:hypothetical protein
MLHKPLIDELLHVPTQDTLDVLQKFGRRSGPQLDKPFDQLSLDNKRHILGKLSGYRPKSSLSTCDLEPNNSRLTLATSCSRPPRTSPSLAEARVLLDPTRLLQRGTQRPAWYMLSHHRAHACTGGT